MLSHVTATDRSIKPIHMAVGDVIVGHHSADPALTPLTLYERDALSTRGPFTVTKILARDRGGYSAGVYFLHPDQGEKRYCPYEVSSGFYVVIRDRPGIPRFIPEFPGVCPRCQDRIYLGLNEVVHQETGSAACPSR